MQIANNRRREGQLMKHYLYQWMDGFEWKIVASILFTIISILQGFYGQLLWGLIGMFSIDLATGLMKSYKNGIPISSRRLRDSVFKLAGYLMLITALTILGKFQADAVALVTLSYYYCMLTEFKSILENVEEMGVKIPPVVGKYINSKLKSPSKKRRKDDKKDDE